MSTSTPKLRAPAYLIIFLIALVIGSYFRTYPLRTHQSRDNRGKATLLVVSRLKTQVARQVDQNYPQASPAQKAALEDKLLKELMRKESDNVAASIAKVEQNIAEASGSQRPYPYLLAADSFHFLQLTQRLLDTGHISDRIEGSKYHNDLMMAPKGHLEPITWHPHIGATVYRFLKIFRPGIDLMEAVGYVPLLLTAAALAAFLLCCRLMAMGPWSTLTGAVFFMCSPIFIKRSSWGWYDNDPYNILFPLLTLAVLFAAFRRPFTLRGATLTAAAVALLMLMYAYFWQGWLLMFGVTAGGLGLAAGVSWLAHRDPQRARREAGCALMYAVLTFVLIAVFFGPQEFFLLCQEGFRALRNFLQPQLSVWPDLYISVGELHQASLFEILIITGGFVFGIVALAGLILSAVMPGSDLDARRKTAVVLGFFLAMSVVITLGAQRFALLCLPPLSLLFTAGLQSLADLAGRRLRRPGSLPGGMWAVRFVLVSLTVLPLYTLHRNMPRLLNPIYNDTWHAAMQEIARRTPENSIVNAWWPPGHFIKATGERRVTFDGATINTPQAYWLTRAYLAQSEQEGIGILRMLNNSANDAADYLEELGWPTSSAVAVLRAVTAINSRQARLLLGTKITDADKVDTLLRMTHSRPAPSYIFIYRDLVEKNIQLAFIGNWNFRKIEELNNHPELLSEVPDRSSKEYVQFLWKLAGGPYKYHTPLREVSRNDEWIVFEKGVRIHRDSKLCAIQSAEFGKGIPQSIFFVRDGQVVEQTFDKPTLGYSVTLFEESGRSFAVLMDRYLAKSLIMRLYYFGDTGMRYVKNFTEKSDLTRQTDIRIFEIDWEAFQKDSQ